MRPATDKVVDRLRELQLETPAIQAAAVVSVDGLPLASTFSLDIDDDRVSAMSSALLSLGDRMSQELNCGAIKQIAMDCRDGTIFLIGIGAKAVLTAVVGDGSDQQLTARQLQSASADILGLL